MRTQHFILPLFIIIFLIGSCTTVISIDNGKDAPNVTITHPSETMVYSSDAEITFKARIEDDVTPDKHLDVKWESDIDGILNTNHPIDQYASFKTTLSKGEHHISLTVKDKNGKVGKDNITVTNLAPAKITLEVNVTEENNAVLSWNKYNDSIFSKYVIYRSQNGVCQTDIIKTITDKNTTEYIDKSLPFSDEICYQVKVVDKSDYFSTSEFVKVSPLYDLTFDYLPSNVLSHPTKKLLYFIYDNSIKIFDYSSASFTKTIEFDNSINKVQIAESGEGKKIVIASDDDKMLICDLENITIEKSIESNYLLNSATFTGFHHLVGALQSNEHTIRIYDYNNNDYLGRTGKYDFNHQDIRKVPGKTAAVSVSVIGFPNKLHYYTFKADGSIDYQYEKMETHFHSFKPFKISKSSDYIIISPSGHMYTSDSRLKYLGKLNDTGNYYSDYTTSDDGLTIYGAPKERKAIEKIDFSTKAITEEIETIGYPKFIFIDDENIISITQFGNFSVEVFNRI